MIGLSPTHSTVMESVGTVEICAVITSGSIASNYSGDPVGVNLVTMIGGCPAAMGKNSIILYYNSPKINVLNED